MPEMKLTHNLLSCSLAVHVTEKDLKAVIIHRAPVTDTGKRWHDTMTHFLTVAKTRFWPCLRLHHVLFMKVGETCQRWHIQVGHQRDQQFGLLSYSYFCVYVVVHRVGLFGVLSPWQYYSAKFHKRATLYSYQDTNESLTCLNAYHLGNAVHFTRWKDLFPMPFSH